MEENNADKCEPNHHVSVISGFCVTCNLPVCKDCVQISHFDHICKIQHRSKELIETVNYLTKLKSATSKAIHLHNEVIRKIDLDDLAQKQEDCIRKDYANFKEFVKLHVKGLILKIKTCKYVDKLKSTYNDAKEKSAKLEKMRAEYISRVKKLLEGSLKGSYESKLIELAKDEELEKQQKELDSYKTLVNELQKYVLKVQTLEAIDSKYTQEKINLRDICRLNTSGLPIEKLIMIKKNQSDVLAYSPNDRKCESFKLNPEYIAPMNFGTAEIGGTLYIVGGNRIDRKGYNIYLNDFISIVIENKTWEHLDPLNEARRRTAVVSVSDKYIYALGGDKEDIFFSSCEKYDFKTKKWIDCPSLTEGRTNISSGVLGGKAIYIFGGYNGTLKDVNIIEKLDVELDDGWERVNIEGNSDWIAQNMGVIQISSEELLLFGGMKEGKLLSECYIFNTDSNKIENISNLERADTFLQIRPKAAASIIYAIGCHHEDLHIFDKNSKKWKLIASKDWMPKLM